MDEREACALLEERLAEWRRRTYDELASLAGREPVTAGLPAPSGATYQLDFEVHCDGAPGGSVRVLAAVDDGGLRAFVPLTDGFIVAADGTFVGE